MNVIALNNNKMYLKLESARLRTYYIKISAFGLIFCFIIIIELEMIQIINKMC